MPRRSSRRLAGCIAIELLLALTARAAQFDYKAGFATHGAAQVLVLEDERRTFAVIVNAAFRLPLAVTDALAAQAAKSFGLDRKNLLLHSTAIAEPVPGDVLQAVESALRNMEPGAVRFGEGTLTVHGTTRCLAALDATARFVGCGEAAGSTVRGRIRAAYRIVDLTRGLRTRNEVPRPTAVQAIALGDSVLLLGAPANVAESGAGRIIAAELPAEDDPRVGWAMEEVLKRVRR